MKKVRCKIIYIFLSCFIVTALTACQENPEEDLVVNKEKTILDKADSDVESKAYLGGKNYVETFYGGDKEVTVEVDINMEGINKNLPILRCAQKDIEVDEIKLWANTLFGNSKVYEPVSVKTKSEIETQILSLKQRISNREGLLAEYENDETGVDSYIEYVEQLIVSLQNAYSSAPENVERKETDWTFHNYSYYDENFALWGDDPENEIMDKSYCFQATADVSGRAALISAMNRNADDYSIHSLTFYYLDEEEMRSLSDHKKITEEQADKLVDEVLKKLGFEDWVLYEKIRNNTDMESQGEQYDYFMYTYVPTYNEIPAFYMPLMDIKSEDAYAANYYYENLEISIENGIVSAVSWNSPLSIKGEEISSVQILDNDEVYEKFKNQIQMTYTVSYLDENYMEGVKACSIEVNDAQFKMMRIKEKNSEEFLVVPVWQFVGDVYVDSDIYGDHVKVGEKQVLAIVNAVDGSTINGELGY